MLNKESLYNEFPKEYNFSENSNNRFVLDTYLKQIENINYSLKAMYNNLDIEKSDGVYLDRFGTIIGIKREEKEEDEVYRARIKVQAFKNLNDTSILQLISILKKIIDEESYIFIFKEGVTPTDEEIEKDLIFNYNIYTGKYSQSLENTLKTSQKVKFKEQGGYIYICLSQRIGQNKKELVTNILNQFKAVGTKIIFDFKYKINTSNYAMGVGRFGTNYRQNITSWLFDNNIDIENYDTNISRANTEMNIKDGTE